MKIQNRDDVALQGLPHSNAKYSSICSSLQSNANCIVHSMVASIGAGYIVEFAGITVVKLMSWLSAAMSMFLGWIGQ
jgi:hypothetical protein